MAMKTRGTDWGVTGNRANLFKRS